LEKNLWVCPKCNYHFRIRFKDYLELLLDPGEWKEYDKNIVSADPLRFKDSKRYPDRIRDSRKKTELSDAVVCGTGKIGGRDVSIAVMDFSFIGGSMGSVVGEKIARAIERSLERKLPLIIVSCSGGARMQEGILSLMQMAKTSALLAQLQKKNLPFISVLTNPTTAGVMASYASLGDVIVAEPKALLGFAGPRVIAQTIGQELPPGFQSSEFFLEHGFLDMICERKELRRTINLLLEYFGCNGMPRK
ncbi:MAG TPA: acetyl-CoA carboxylase, carboxyltransferase subunit beta, partial [candidate division Zixibacteria bacterium]|nr:acetyl-CoA carboxylase, carboxyltransferase subunit beta [candidate division Zixibacteria bacterium]